ncbi:MAG: spermidine/putrescine ABC transporter substrate-binding protein [bacterium]|nr:spermidine/putrescine ABC transporter substrate-binding protein [bacterium]
MTDALKAFLLALLIAVPVRVGAVDAAPSPGKEGLPELVFLTWADYMDPALVQAFEQTHGARVRFVYFESDDDRNDILVERDGRGYDLIMVNGIMLESYVRRGWLEPLREAELPNLGHIDRRWREALPKASGYGVPYTWGSVGIAYRKDLVPSPVTSWMQIFLPHESLRGRIAMIKNARDTVGLALKALGHSANSEDLAAHRDAEQLLLGQRPFVRSYTYISVDEDSALLSGEVAMAMAYNGDALVLKEKNAAVEYVVPEEGSTLWVDYLTVAAESSSKELAWKFVDFLARPESAVRTARLLYYATPNRTAEKLLPADFLSDPTIYPPKNVIARSEFEARLAPRVLKARNTIFARVLQ